MIILCDILCLSAVERSKKDGKVKSYSNSRSVMLLFVGFFFCGDEMVDSGFLKND